MSSFSRHQVNLYLQSKSAPTVLSLVLISKCKVHDGDSVKSLNRFMWWCLFYVGFNGNRLIVLLNTLNITQLMWCSYFSSITLTLVLMDIIVSSLCRLQQPHCSSLFLTCSAHNECELCSVAVSWFSDSILKWFTEVSAPACDTMMKDIHRHTSTCLVVRRSLGVLIINAHLPSTLHHLAAHSVSVSAGEMCSSEPRWASVASYWVSARQQSGFSGDQVNSSPPAHHCPFPSVHRASLTHQVSPAALLHRSRCARTVGGMKRR